MTHHTIPTRRLAVLIGAALTLFACQNAGTLTASKDDGQIQVLRLADGETPPQIAGQCWASDTAPAVIETVTQQVQVQPERRNSAGVVTQPAEFETQTSQRILDDRATVWFKAPCPDQLTTAFIASLQRALKARGWYNAPVTGAMDAPTTEALRRYQRSIGLDSAQVSQGAAQNLGLLAVDL
jgi:hypothetical protein